MKTVKIKMVCETGFAGSDHETEEEFEFEDDATDEEIEQELEHATKEWMFGMINFYYERL